MEVEKPIAKTSKTVQHFKLIYTFVYLTGWPSFWYSPLDLPSVFIKYHSVLSVFLNFCNYLLYILELSALITQNNLSDKQKSDSQLFTFSHIFLGNYGLILTYYQKNIMAMTYSLIVELKKYYINEAIEEAMLKKSRMHIFCNVAIIFSALLFYGIDGVMSELFKDGTFVTIITGWPDVHDHSSWAGWFRVFAYILWWIFMIRATGIYAMLISTLVCLGHQYKNLQSYFDNLNNIFENDEITMKEKEEKYEKGLKLGIRMHARTLWCTRECELAYMGVVSGQIVVNITVIILLMSQMLTSERTLASVAATISTMSAMLISTGFFMWNAGDMTVEAEAVATAMYSSGWHHCRRAASTRARKLLVMAMAQAQVPVYIRAFGFVPLSYESYVSIVKSSYSVFSVLY